MAEISSTDVIELALIARCRELLGDEAVGLSDEEVDRIRRHADTMAHVVIEMFLQVRSPVHTRDDHETLAIVGKRA
jgi:hypothetical protein